MQVFVTATGDFCIYFSFACEHSCPTVRGSLSPRQSIYLSIHLSGYHRHNSGSDYCSCYHGFYLDLGGNKHSELKLTSTLLFTVGDTYRRLTHHAASSHHIILSTCQWLAFHSAWIRGWLFWPHWDGIDDQRELWFAAVVLWPQQMPPQWPSVQTVIMNRREKRVKWCMQRVGVNSEGNSPEN